MCSKEKFRISCGNNNRIPRTSEKLKVIMDTAANDARKVCMIMLSNIAFVETCSESQSSSTFSLSTDYLLTYLHRFLKSRVNEVRTKVYLRHTQA